MRKLLVVLAIVSMFGLTSCNKAEMEKLVQEKAELETAKTKAEADLKTATDSLTTVTKEKADCATSLETITKERDDLKTKVEAAAKTEVKEEVKTEEVKEEPKK